MKDATNKQTKNQTTKETKTMETTTHNEIETAAIAAAYGADQTKLIRKAYKARGWNRNAIAVKNHSYSMGSSMRVTIKQPAVASDYAEILRLANAGEKISYCEITNEILSGGNRFVTVDFSDEAKTYLAAPIMGDVTRACVKANEDKNGSSIYRIEGTRYGVKVETHEVQIWTLDGPGGTFRICNYEGFAEGVAHHVAVKMFKEAK